MTTVSEALANLYDVAAEMTRDPTLQSRLRELYGIDVGFSGLGLAVNGSGDPRFITASENSLDNGIVPEYLARNVAIADAHCRCILVRPYPGRDHDMVDPDFIWRVGTPECRNVQRLPHDGRTHHRAWSGGAE